MTTEPMSVSLDDKPFPVFTNPTFPELSRIGHKIRFIANNGNKVIYVWNFNDGFHTQLALALKLTENFSPSDLLRGHAEKKDNGTYEMVGSNLLDSFLEKMTKRDRVLLDDLMNQDWSWVDDYIKITGWMSSFRESLALQRLE